MFLYGLGNAVKARTHQDEYSDAENAAFEIAYIVQGETVVTESRRVRARFRRIRLIRNTGVPGSGLCDLYASDKEWNKPYNFL